MKTLAFSLSLILLFACSNPEKESNEEEKSVNDSVAEMVSEHSNDSSALIASKVEEDLVYASLISNYLKANEAKLHDGEGYKISYMTDKAERDGKAYYTVQIGANDEDRFTTMQWIYIDSVTHDIYELDPVEDQLELWQ